MYTALLSQKSQRVAA